MTKRRPTIKGRGVDIFLGEEKSTLEPKIKATFYLPASIIEELDDFWLKRRRKNRRIKKSDIVSESLRKFLVENK
jgi:hypothetical protein